LPTIECDRKRQKAKLYKIEPTRSTAKEEFVLYLENCKKCGSSIVEIIAFDFLDNQFPIKRIKNEAALAFIEKMYVIEELKELSKREKPLINLSWIFGHGNDKGNSVTPSYLDGGKKAGQLQKIETIIYKLAS